MLLNYYLELLGIKEMPEFLKKYLEIPSLTRLKKVGYFCGMDYASKNIYYFKEHISRYDHSLSVALLTYKLTKDKKATLAGLFHDIATPCFSHVIDYMNNDFVTQESTEEFTEKIIRNDKHILECLKKDNIAVDDIVDFKKYTIVDNNRPKICADRIDGIVLTGIAWTKNIDRDDIKKIVESLTVYINEYDEEEIGFSNIDVTNKVIEVNESIDIYCTSIHDNYMMLLLAEITKYLINNSYISYNDLYNFDEEQLLELIKSIDDSELKELFNKFENITKEDIPNFELPKLKKRIINPLVNGKRFDN